MIWVVLAVVSVFLEMLTRTFTLLAVAIGFGVAALLAWMGFGFLIELIAAVIVGFFCVLWLRKSPTGIALQEAEESRHSVISDDGDEVHISQWDDGGKVDVVFKGRTWEAQIAEGYSPHRGDFRVREVREGKLILEEMPVAKAVPTTQPPSGSSGSTSASGSSSASASPRRPAAPVRQSKP